MHQRIESEIDLILTMQCHNPSPKIVSILWTSLAVQLPLRNC
jgi:hypothetical protein